MKNFIYILLAICLTNCASNPNSYKFEKERVTVTLENSSKNKSKNEKIGLSSLTGLAPQVLEFGAKKLNEAIEKESKKYVATYNGSETDQDFYADDKGTLQHNTLKIERRSTIDTNNSLNSEIVLKFESNNENTLLRLKTHKIKIIHSKAKLREKDTTVDLKINVKLIGFWKNKNGVVESKTVGDVSLQMKDIKLGAEYPNEKNKLPEIASDWFASIPYSVNNNGVILKNARGNYTVVVEVTEMDDYGKRVEQFGKIASKGTEALTGFISDLIKE